MSLRAQKEQSILSLVLADTVTSEDMRQLAAEVLAFERDQPMVLARLTDLRSIASMDISFPDILDLVRIRKGQTFPNSFRSAILVKDPVQMGYARMFQNLNDHPQITVKIFTDEAEARAWLTKK